MSKGKGVGDGIMVVWGRGWRSIGPSGHSERQSGWQVVEDMGLERLTKAIIKPGHAWGDSFQSSSVLECWGVLFSKENLLPYRPGCITAHCRRSVRLNF